MNITKILVPITHRIDPQLIQYTKDLATEHNASLTILYITSPLTLTNYYAYPSMLYSIANMNLDSIQVAHETLAEQIDTLIGDFPHETLCLVGPTTDTILRISEQKGIDLIVIPGAPDTASGKFMVKPKRDKLSQKTSIPIMTYNG